MPETIAAERLSVPKWLIPVLVSLAVTLLGTVSVSAVTSFKASEAYDLSKDIPTIKAVNDVDHKAIKDQLDRIEKKLDAMKVTP